MIIREWLIIISESKDYRRAAQRAQNRRLQHARPCLHLIWKTDHRISLVRGLYIGVIVSAIVGVSEEGRIGVLTGVLVGGNWIVGRAQEVNMIMNASRIRGCFCNTTSFLTIYSNPR